MQIDKLISVLRSATEDDVLKALDGEKVETPLSKPSDLLEFYNRVVDVLLEAGNVVAAADLHRISPGFRTIEADAARKN